MLASRLKPASSASKRLMKNSSSRFDNLWLFYLGEPAAPHLVGELRYLQLTRSVSLTYAESWIESGFRLSEDLPLSVNETSPREPARAVGAVDDARPDRWGERVIQFVDRPERLSLMEYLYFAGDDRFGALGVSSSPDSYQPRKSTPLPRLDEAQALSDVVRKIANKEALTAQERAIAHAGGSLGGAKPKALIRIDGEEWIIKFFAGEPIDAPLIEHASMTLALKAGIRAAETRVVPLLGENAILVRRFPMQCRSARSLAFQTRRPQTPLSRSSRLSMVGRNTLMLATLRALTSTIFPIGSRDICLTCAVRSIRKTMPVDLCGGAESRFDHGQPLKEGTIPNCRRAHPTRT
jgi:HipA-like C-terminal domain/HipA N-terminal domain